MLPRVARKIERENEIDGERTPRSCGLVDALDAIAA